MTKSEEQSLARLSQVTADLREENRMFRNDMTTLIEQINRKVESKHAPIHLESDILKVVEVAMGDSIKAVLSGYNSPLSALVKTVVEAHNPQLRAIITDSFNEVIQKDEFKRSIVDAFSHKIARSVISNNDGLFEKVSNELKQDAVFKSKMALAVSNVVNEVLNERKGNV